MWLLSNSCGLFTLSTPPRIPPHLMLSAVVGVLTSFTILHEVENPCPILTQDHGSFVCHLRKPVQQILVTWNSIESKFKVEIPSDRRRPDGFPEKFLPENRLKFRFP